MRHWKNTILKSNQIKWKRPPIKNIEDGKLDMLIKISLTSLFEIQAKTAFADGMLAMLEFHVKKQGENETIEIEDLIKFFTDCGLPEIGERLLKEKNE